MPDKTIYPPDVFGQIQLAQGERDTAQRILDRTLVDHKFNLDLQKSINDEIHQVYKKLEGLQEEANALQGKVQSGRDRIMDCHVAIHKAETQLAALTGETIKARQLKRKFALSQGCQAIMQFLPLKQVVMLQGLNRRFYQLVPGWVNSLGVKLDIEYRWLEPPVEPARHPKCKEKIWPSEEDRTSMSRDEKQATFITDMVSSQGYRNCEGAVLNSGKMIDSGNDTYNWLFYAPGQDVHILVCYHETPYGLSLLDVHSVDKVFRQHLEHLSVSETCAVMTEIKQNERIVAIRGWRHEETKVWYDVRFLIATYNF